MAEKKIYIGSYGPALYDDTDDVDDADGDFSGKTQKALTTDGAADIESDLSVGGDLDVTGDVDVGGTVTVGSIKLDDIDDSNTLELKWNENSVADYVLNLLVGGGDRSLTLNENFTVGDGADITITGVTAARTLTMNENFTIGDGYDGTITFKNASKAINVEDTNLIPRTGWPTIPGVTLSFDDGTRTFTVTDGGSAFYYILGIKYILGGNKTVIIDDTEGLWYIYFDGETLTASQTIWSFLAEDKALVAYLYWDSTAENEKSIFLGYELHTFHMDGSTHGRLHYATGARWESGLLVSDAGSENINVDAGNIWDEDLNLAISDGAGAALFEQVLSPAELPIYYRSGTTDWRIYEKTDKANATDAGYVDAGHNLHYNKLNGTWASTAAGGSKHVAYYVVATNEQTEPVALIMGQRQDTTLANAKENNVFSGLTLTGLPFEEMVVLARLILKEVASGLYYTLEDVTDLRAAFGDGNITSPLITDHGGLGGLGDDDHQQYILHSLFDADSFLYATSDNTPVATSPANVMAALSGHAGAAFSFNSQNVTGGTYNALTLTAAATGFTIAGGDTPKTLTVDDTFVVSTQLSAIGANTSKVTCNFTNVQTALAAASGAVDFNSQALTGVGAIGCGTITSTGNLIIANAGNIGSVGDTDAIAISAAGVLTFSGQSGARAYLAANQTITTGTPTKLHLVTENYDVQNDFVPWDSGDAANTGRFVVAVAGKYIITGVPELAGVNDGEYIVASIYVNGAQATTTKSLSALDGSSMYSSVTDILDLSINDYIELYVQHNHGSDLTAHGAYSEFNFMAVHKLS